MRNRGARMGFRPPATSCRTCLPVAAMLLAILDASNCHGAVESAIPARNPAYVMSSGAGEHSGLLPGESREFGVGVLWSLQMDGLAPRLLMNDFASTDQAGDSPRGAAARAFPLIGVRILASAPTSTTESSGRTLPPSPRSLFQSVNVDGTLGNVQSPSRSLSVKRTATTSPGQTGSAWAFLEDSDRLESLWTSEDQRLVVATVAGQTAIYFESGPPMELGPGVLLGDPVMDGALTRLGCVVHEEREGYPRIVVADVRTRQVLLDRAHREYAEPVCFIGSGSVLCGTDEGRYFSISMGDGDSTAVPLPAGRRHLSADKNTLGIAYRTEEKALQHSVLRLYDITGAAPIVVSTVESTGSFDACAISETGKYSAMQTTSGISIWQREGALVRFFAYTVTPIPYGLDFIDDRYLVDGTTLWQRIPVVMMLSTRSISLYDATAQE